MQGLQALVANEQAFEAMQPGDGALRHPAIAPESHRTLDAFARDAAAQAAAAEVAPTVAHVVALVRMDCVRADAWSPAPRWQRRDGLE